MRESVASGKCPCGRDVSVTITTVSEKPNNVKFEHEGEETFWKLVYSVGADTPYPNVLFGGKDL